MKKKKVELGCCGYDELAVKPPTTQPIRFGIRVSNIKREENDPGMTRRISSMGAATVRYPVVNVVEP